MRSAIFLLTILSLLAGAGCSHHVTTDANKKTGIASIQDTLTGTWQVTNSEIPSFGTTELRNEFVTKMAPFQTMIKSVPVTLNKNGTYSVSLNGQTDTGTWQVNGQRSLEIVSKASGSTVTFQIVSLSSTTMVVKYTPGDGEILVTFTKQ
jgi:hypothetical protein